jgi:hypothetical protein
MEDGSGRRYAGSHRRRFLGSEKCRYSLLRPYLYQGRLANVARPALPSLSHEGTCEAAFNATCARIVAVAFDLSDIAAIACVLRHYERRSVEQEVGRLDQVNESGGKKIKTLDTMQVR